MQATFQIRIPNPFYKPLHRLRMARATRKWNADLTWIQAQCLTDDDRLMWSALVWQEVWMWIRIADPSKPPEELEWLSRRRGFTAVQRAYLEQMMRHVWLWKPQNVRAEPQPEHHTAARTEA